MSYQLPEWLENWIDFICHQQIYPLHQPYQHTWIFAGGKPVISTAITDVVNPYYDLGLVHIVQNADELVHKATAELNNAEKSDWLKKIDAYLSAISWDATWERMDELMQNEIDTKQEL